MTHENEEAARSGRVAIVGRPNTGKSTLLNGMLDQTLAVATERPGTTRNAIVGVYYEENPETQIAFVDTPGIGHSKTALHRLLVDEAQQSLADVDAIVMVSGLDPNDSPADALKRDRRILDVLRNVPGKTPIVLVLNKVDLLRDKTKLFPLLKTYEEALPFAALIPLSAKNDDSFAPVIDTLRPLLGEGLLYDADYLTDRSQRFFAAEFVRGAAMQHLRDELPYGVAVQIDAFEDVTKHVSITATLIVEKDSHKGIVIGKKGASIKRIGTEARVAIEAHLERKVFLKLWVKVMPGWTLDPRKARELLGT